MAGGGQADIAWLPSPGLPGHQGDGPERPAAVPVVAAARPGWPASDGRHIGCIVAHTPGEVDSIGQVEP